MYEKLRSTEAEPTDLNISNADITAFHTNSPLSKLLEEAQGVIKVVSQIVNAVAQHR